MKDLATFSDSILYFFKIKDRSYPLQYSNTVAKLLSSISIVSMHLIIFIWFKFLFTLFSRTACLI